MHIYIYIYMYMYTYPLRGGGAGCWSSARACQLHVISIAAVQGPALWLSCHDGGFSGARLSLAACLMLARTCPADCTAVIACYIPACAEVGTRLLIRCYGHVCDPRALLCCSAATICIYIYIYVYTYQEKNNIHHHQLRGVWQFFFGGCVPAL